MILGASILQLPAIQKAKGMGLEVVAVDMNPHAVGFQYADICLPISTIDIPAIVKAAKEYSINGVITLASDMPMRAVAAVVTECGLVGVDPDTALRATNKVVMRRALKAHGVPIPEFHKVSSRDEYDTAVESFKTAGVKFIVKPADNSGSRGVYLVETLDDQAAIEAAYHHSKEFSRSGDIVVEEFMEGPEVSVETLSIDGECHVIQITDKLTTGAPFFVEMGHSQPTQLPPAVADEIRRIAAMAVEAIGIKDGPSHTEIIATPTGAKVVELGARLGGDCITTHLVPLSTGVDMVKCCIQIALGEKPDIAAILAQGSAIRYFESHAGKLAGIEGLDAAKGISGVREIGIAKELDQNITDILSSTDRVGFLIAQGEDAQDAIHIAEKARDCIHLCIK
jgi:biotin carboxylase